MLFSSAESSVKSQSECSIQKLGRSLAVGRTTNCGVGCWAVLTQEGLACPRDLLASPNTALLSLTENALSSLKK